MAEPTLYPKFLRGLTTSNAANAAQSMSYFLRVFYEFWGFCVNGTNDLKAPGGFSTSHTTGTYIVMPTGWESGSTVLRASGSDGSTFQGTKLFTSPSAKFSASFKGRHITIWESGSLSTDDSIYPIVEWINSSSIMIDPTYGGTVTNPSGSVPEMTTRTNLNWRVIDYDVACKITPYSQPGFLVIEFNDAGKVNPGQRRSQVKISTRGDANNWDDFRFQMSPSGSWDGTQFVGFAEGSTYCPDTLLDGGYGSGGWAFNQFFHGVGGIGFITLIADKTFVIAQAAGSAFGWPSAFLFEVPRRLYPAHMDPNPICGFAAGAVEVQTIASQGWGWASRHMPSPYDSTSRRYQGAIPCYNGWVWERSMHTNFAPQTLASNRYPVFYNPVINTTYLPPVTMYLGWFFTQDDALNPQPSVQGKTSMGRVRLRSQRQVTGGYQRLARIQDGANKWIHVGAGVLWPWDHAYVPTRHLFKDMADGFNFS